MARLGRYFLPGQALHLIQRDALGEGQRAPRLLNPVRAGMTPAPEDYPWSSYAQHALD